MVIDICNELNKREGVEAQVLIFSDFNQYPNLTTNLKVNVIPSGVVPSALRPWQVNIAAYNAFVTDYKPDVIHTHMLDADLVAYTHVLPGVRYVSHMHSEAYDLFNKLSVNTLLSKHKLGDFRVKRKLEKAYKEANTQFISISSFITEYFEQRFPKELADNIHTIYNCIDYTKYSALGDTGRQDDEIVRLVNVARFAKVKNQQFLVPVIKKLVDSGVTNFKLTLMGDGVERPKVIDEVKRLGLEQYIELPGTINNVEDHLQRGHIFSYASIDGLFGLTLLEAMAAGLPFVALRGNNDGDRLKDGVNGFIIDNNSVDDYADKLGKLIKDRELRLKIGATNRLFSKQFDVTEYVDALLEVYQI